MKRLQVSAVFKIALGLLVLLIAGVCHGQTTAVVTGTVKDASGAVMPGASVTATNISTGIISKTTTNRDGLYRIDNLVVGTYIVEASKPGFKNVLQENIELNVEDVAEFNFVMQVGAVTESVTIDASGALIETETATLGDDIQGRLVQEAPLNGRNVMNLMELVPGVLPEGLSAGDPASNQGSNNTNQAGFGAYSVGGGASGSNQTYVDGVSVVTSGTTVGIIPSTDSVGEFRVDANATSPEFGAFGGGVISFSTKSGTNAFHGTAFEYLRNTALDANTWWNDHFGGPAGGFPVSVLHQNQYGGTVGGPIVKKKAFFFFSYAATRLSTFAQQEFWAPTPAEMKGDFTADYGTTTDKINDFFPVLSANPPLQTTASLAQVNNPPENCPGGGINKICPAHLSPMVQKMFALNYYNPIASDPAQLGRLEAQGYNQTIASAQPNNEGQYVGRIDYQLSDKQSLFVRTTYWTTYIPNCTPCKMPALPTQPTFFTSQNDVVGDHYTLNTTTAFDLKLGWTRWSRTQSSNGNGNFNMAQFGSQWANIQSQLAFKAPPDINQQTTWTNTPFSINLYALGQNDTYNILGSVTKVAGRHTLQTGFEMRRVESYSLAPTAGTQGGGFTFTHGESLYPATNPFGVQLGGMAEMLTGVAEGGAIATTVPTEAYSYYQGYYVNDTWKARKKLTVTLGLRWELPGASADKHNRTTVFLANVPNPTLSSIVNPMTGGPTQLLGNLVEVASPAYPSKWTSQIHYHLFDPRLGVAYSIGPKTVIRAGFGISHPGGGSAGAGGPLVSASTPTVAGYSSMDNPWASGPLLQPLQRSTHLMDPYSSFQQTLLGTGNAGGLQAQMATYIEQWNLNVERAVTKTLAASVSYVGNKAIHSGGALTLGQMPDQFLQCNNVAYPNKLLLPSLCSGHYLTDQVANPLYGFASPAGKAGTQTTTAAQLLLPYPEFTNAPTGVNEGHSSYNALLVSVKQRLPLGGVITTAFTWAHSLVLGSPTDINNLSIQRAYANAADDVPTYFTMSYVTDLPFGKGKKFLGNANGVLDAIVGGWGFQGITQFESGLPMAFSINGGTALSSAGTGLGAPRPSVVQGVSKRTTGSRFQRINSAWFNTAAFSIPTGCATANTCWNFGNETSIDSTLRADAEKNWDMSLVKNVKFKEGISLQFRAEYFNVFNHPQYGTPGTALGSASFGVIAANTANGQTTGPQPRIGQIAARLTF